MRSLKQKLLAAVAFENCDGNSPETERGRQIAHSSLTPILEKLIDCAVALEETSCTICKPISMTDALIQLSEIETRNDKVLTALAEVVEAKDS